MLVERVPSTPAADQEVLLDLTLPRRDALLAFWRAFRRLQSEVEPDAYQREWRHPMPQRAVERLTWRVRGAAP